MDSMRYSTGKPCKRGHVAERLRSNRSCVECQRIATTRRANRPLYQTWRLMIGRCHNPSGYGYGKYGAKGIRVCDRWHKYVNFYADMGDKPEGATLDRIDPRGNYEPDNCRWASIVQQANNKTSTRFLVLDGEKIPLAEAARRHGLTHKQVLARVSLLGWTDQEAVALPIKFGSRKGHHRNSKKTHCVRGHELSGENLYQRKNGRRECRTCNRARQT